MDLDALGAIFARTAETTRGTAPSRPESRPSTPPPLPLAGPEADPSGWEEAREERAAIMQHDGGMIQAEAETGAALLHPAPGSPDPGALLHSFTLADLATAAGEDWPEIAARPEAIDAFAFLRRTRTQRERGERPTHYTRPALCATCGPVWLWEPGPRRVLACPWCMAPPPPGVAIPRPPVERGGCAHFEASATDPAAGVGACRIEAPASRHGPALWPCATRFCGAWRPAVDDSRQTLEQAPALGHGLLTPIDEESR